MPNTGPLSVAGILIRNIVWGSKDKDTKSPNDRREGKSGPPSGKGK